ncbi:MAG TPA: helix-turn-helix domain-containing protein [Chloroflexia bacterium]|nr:helix-turn-helix domain-containing protein [Chloroflexia bacterium]
MDTIDTSLTFGQWVRKNRKAQGWTQTQLAEIVDYSANMIRKIEAGKAHPSALGIARILQAFEVVPADYRAVLRWAHSTPLPARAQAVPGARLGNRAGLAASAPSAGGMLPTWPTPLIGRDTDLAALTGLLTARPHRILTLTGPGGSGKTRLAVQAAGAAAPGFPDGVWFTDLATVHDPTDLLPHIARTLGLRPSRGRPVGPPVSAFLAPQHALLLLDNAEHLPAAVPQIAALVTQAPHLTVLVTSRCPLHLYGEQVIPVRGLAVPPPHATPAQVEATPAGRLLVERVRVLDPEFIVTAPVAPALAAICARLDGLPLALELAAAHLRVLSPAGLLARLDQPHAVLIGGARDLPARQQSLEASLDWSYGLLTDQEQTLFRRLAAVPDGARLHEIARICNPARDLRADLHVLLEALVDQQLVQVAAGPQGEPYFYLPALVRAYAAARRAADPAEIGVRRARPFAPRDPACAPNLTLIVPSPEVLPENTNGRLLTKPGGSLPNPFAAMVRRPLTPRSHAPPAPPCPAIAQSWLTQVDAPGRGSAAEIGLSAYPSMSMLET